MNHNVNPATILIIDDEAIIRQSFADYLEDQGYQILTAENGRRGLEILEREQPDLMLTDLRMPEVNGLEVITRSRQRVPDTPIIVVSGAGRIDDAVQALRLGAWDYILKPVTDMSVLEHRVEKALEKARLIRENRMYQKNLERMVRERTAELEATNVALRASETRYRMLVEQSLQGMVIAQDNPVRLRFASQPMQAICGFAPQELTRFGPAQLAGLIHPADRATFFGNFRARLSGEPVPSRHEYRVIHKSGAVRWVEIYSSRIEYEGSPATQTVFLDITERKHAEVEREQLLVQVREQAQRIQQTIDTVPEGVVLLDVGGRVVLANPVAEHDLAFLAGVKVGDILMRLGKRPLIELLTSPPTKGLWHEVKIDGRTFEVIARPMEPPAASREPPAVGWEPPAAGRAESWVLVINDVTQARAVREQLQRQERLAAVGQLAAGIAHDFNNIMAVIVLYAQMGLRRLDLPAALRQRLEVIDQQAKQATAMIQQILDFSRRAVLERRPMDLMPFLKEVVKLLERTVPESIKLEFTYGLDEAEGANPYTVLADPTRMQQAIMNLAINARDAMPGGGELRIDLAWVQVESYAEPPLPEMTAGEWVRITVTDTGSGIPPDVLPHIFEPFFTTKEIGKGTGLGLAQVYGIVAAHEGHIDVCTTDGAGTTFTLYLPALQQQPPESVNLSTQDLVSGQGETLLIVEDNATVRQALANTLASLNYRVLEAADGRAALELLSQFPPSVSTMGRTEEGIALILSDLVMPEMGGQALFHAIQQRGLTLPMVMLSGHSMENELQALQVQGLAGWLRKPPDMAQLSWTLAQALGKHPSK